MTLVMTRCEKAQMFTSYNIDNYWQRMGIQMSMIFNLVVKGNKLGDLPKVKGYELKFLLFHGDA